MFKSIPFQLVPIRVCLVTEGEVAYIGGTEGALELFSDVGYPCPNNFNPADHYIFTLAIRPGVEEKCKEKCKVLLTFRYLHLYYC